MKHNLVVVDFNKDWLKTMSVTKLTPIAYLKRTMLDEYTELAVVDQTSTSITFRIYDDALTPASVKKNIETVMQDKYSLPAEKMLVCRIEEKEASYSDGDVSAAIDDLVRILDGNEADDEADKPSEPVAKKKVITFGKKQPTKEQKGTPTFSKGESESTDDAPEVENTPTRLETILNELNQLPGAREFKALINEIVDMAPVIKSNGSEDVFLYQSYLFSINEGCGIENHVNIFADVISELGLAKLSSRKKISYQKPAETGNGKEVFTDVLNAVARLGSDGVTLVCIDISDYITEINSTRFKFFLNALNEIKGNNMIYIFRLPFVEKEVLERTVTGLEDLLYVRSVTFPPYTISELRGFAETELTKRSFSMDESSWELFSARIAEEKRDGKFYGINTVKKVVNEIIYDKLLALSHSESKDKLIVPEDIRGLVSLESLDKRSGFEMLDALEGTKEIKEKVLEIISQIEFARSNQSLGTPAIHMRFVGNPGTGKTTVARIIGRILRERGILKVGDFFEYSGRDFVGRYIGETAPKVTGMCRDAYGSVLFIDEAYSLCRDPRDGKDFGKEALDTLIAEMENHRDEMVVIFAGYPDEMDTMLEGNVGLASRIPYTLEFKNFTKEQLYNIFAKMLDGKLEYEDGLLDDVKEYFMGLSDKYISSKKFSNARFVRNLFERTWGKAALRCQLAGEDKIVITRDDFKRATQEREFASLDEKKKTSRIGF